MKYLQITSIISYLLINGLGPHGTPNLIGIPYCLFVFIEETVIMPFNKISWGLGFVWIFTSASIIGILYSRKYTDRYWLIIYFLILLAVEIFFSGIIDHHSSIIGWFFIPLTIFLVSTTLLIIKSFRGKDEITNY